MAVEQTNTSAKPEICLSPNQPTSTKQSAKPKKLRVPAEEATTPSNEAQFTTAEPSEVALLLSEPENEIEKKIEEEQSKGREQLAKERMQSNKPVSLLNVSKETVQIHEGTNILERSKFIPLRLSAEERDLHSLLEGTLEISE